MTCLGHHIPIFDVLTIFLGHSHVKNANIKSKFLDKSLICTDFSNFDLKKFQKKISIFSFFFTETLQWMPNSCWMYLIMISAIASDFLPIFRQHALNSKLHTEMCTFQLQVAKKIFRRH